MNQDLEERIENPIIIIKKPTKPYKKRAQPDFKIEKKKVIVNFD